MNYHTFIQKYKQVLQAYWEGIKNDVTRWKQQYEWPKNVKLDEALWLRDKLEKAIKHDLDKAGYLSKDTFDKIIKWGFGRKSSNGEKEIATQTKKAFLLLREDKLAEAALELTMLEGIGISRASKILALSDQKFFGIYDSRSAHGLSDLCCDGKRLIPVPPGRVIKGDIFSPREFCSAFQLYNHVLRFFWELAQKDLSLSSDFSRVADLEIAFFTRSRAGYMRKEQSNFLRAETSRQSLDETDAYFTLGVGRKAKQFWAFVDENGLYILTGLEGKTQLCLTNSQIERCLSHFRSKGWFLLGNAVDNVKAGSMGEYFRETLKTSPKFASHFASIMVDQGRLIYRYGSYSRVELKVNDDLD